MPIGWSTNAETRILAETPESQYEIAAIKIKNPTEYKTNLKATFGIRSDMICTSEKYPKGQKSQSKSISRPAGGRISGHNVQYSNS